jgi:YidC/Oxa1 family membrane protein insertase
MTQSNQGIKAFFYSWKEYRRFNALTTEQRAIVFYSESAQDWHHLRPYIFGIMAQGKTVVYVTSDRDDPSFLQNNPLLMPFFIKNGFWVITFFNMCAADVFVLTMTDLHSFHVKRSMYPVHYCYLFHAMGSTHMVDFAESYDHYDTILCSGPHQITEIRARET